MNKIICALLGFITLGACQEIIEANGTKYFLSFPLEVGA